MEPQKRNLMIYRPLGKNNFSKRVWAVKYFKMIHQREANAVRYFDMDKEVEARKFARENNGIIYKDIKIIK